MRSSSHLIVILKLLNGRQRKRGKETPQKRVSTCCRLSASVQLLLLLLRLVQQQQHRQPHRLPLVVVEPLLLPLAQHQQQQQPPCLPLVVVVELLHLEVQLLPLLLPLVAVVGLLRLEVPLLPRAQALVAAVGLLRLYVRRVYPHGNRGCMCVLCVGQPANHRRDGGCTTTSLPSPPLTPLHSSARCRN
jgi:hypothetical protein